jgi:hypothetical protein
MTVEQQSILDAITDPKRRAIIAALFTKALGSKNFDVALCPTVTKRKGRLPKR